MAHTVRGVQYFNVTVPDQPGRAHELLSQLAHSGVNLMALTAIPVGPDATQMTLFPEDANVLKTAAERARLHLDGPHRALLVQGDDELGALASVLGRLADADVNIYASYAVTDGKGHFGDILYVRPEHYDRAAKELRV
ncbi:MAG TPA: hypothetical protein VLV15_16965 [Dongiaceae bacterium]|nr:hypothetical protein [Dongiaceae bacterium]